MLVSTQTKIHYFSGTDVVLRLTLIASCAQDPGASSLTCHFGHLITRAVYMQQCSHLMGRGEFLKWVVFTSLRYWKTHKHPFLSIILSLIQHLLCLYSNRITIYLCSLCRCWFYIYQFSDRNVNRCNAEDKRGHLQDWAVRSMIAFSDTHHPFFTCYSTP